MIPGILLFFLGLLVVEVTYKYGLDFIKGYSKADFIGKAIDVIVLTIMCSVALVCFEASLDHVLTAWNN